MIVHMRTALHFIFVFSFVGIPLSLQRRLYKTRSSKPTASAKVAGLLTEKAPEGRLEYMCSIQEKSSGMYYCGATLIQAEWILTAAHCFDDPKLNRRPKEDFQIYCNITSLSDGDPKKRFEITELEVHERWDGEVGHGSDIALAKLDRKTDLRVTLLDDVSSKYGIGQLFSVAGFGSTGYSAEPNGELLINANTWYISLKQCNKPDKWKKTIDKSMICAGIENTGACKGDSGGPLLRLDRVGHKGWKAGDPQNDIIVGIVSFGEEDSICDEKLPGVYTRVSFFRNWIDIQIHGTDVCNGGDDDGVVSLGEINEEVNAEPRASEESDFRVGCCFRVEETLDLCMKEYSCIEDDMTTIDKEMRTAIDEDNAARVQEVLCCGFDPNSKIGIYQDPSIIYAIESNAFESLTVLLQNGADIESTDTEGNSPIAYCAFRNRLEILKYLIGCGGNVDKANELKSTPLHLAASYGYLRVAEILVRAGASLSSSDKEGETPFDKICDLAGNACLEKDRKRLTELLSR